VRFDETWIGEDQLTHTAGLSASTAKLYGEVFEIGAWQGRSAVPIANAVAPDVLHVVDHWKGQPEIPPWLTARDNYGIFLANMDEGTEGNYKVWKMDWREFAAQWTAPIRFLHLDADHVFDEVFYNLHALRPFALPGAVFAGDDWSYESVQRGVRMAFPSHEIHTGAGRLWWVVL